MDRREGGKDTGAPGGEECRENQGLHGRDKCRGHRGDRDREGRRTQQVVDAGGTKGVG